MTNQPTISNAYPSFQAATREDHRAFSGLRAELLALNKEAGDSRQRMDEYAVTRGWGYVDHVCIPMKVGRGDKVHKGHASAYIAPSGGWIIVGGSVWCGSKRWGSGQYAVFSGQPLERGDERVTCRKCGGGQ